MKLTASSSVLVLAIALIAAAVTVGAGCPAPGPTPLGGQATSGDLLATIDVDTRIVRPGDTVNVTLTVRNTGGEPMVIEAPTSAPIIVAVWRYDLRFGWRRVREYPETALYRLTTWTLTPGGEGERTYEMPLTVEKDWPVLNRAKITAELNGRPGARPFVLIDVLPVLEAPSTQPAPPAGDASEASS